MSSKRQKRLQRVAVAVTVKPTESKTSQFTLVQGAQRAILIERFGLSDETVGELFAYTSEKFHVVRQVFSNNSEILRIIPLTSFDHWNDFQMIKNEICGTDRDATELYPAESRRCNTTAAYYLTVLPEGERFSFGFPSGYGESCSPALSQ